MQRRGQLRNNSKFYDSLAWETKPDSNADIFLVKRDSDNATEYFNYTELSDGTYNTWIAGANGNILQWINNGEILTGETIKLTGGADPLVKDELEASRFKGMIPFDMSGDWVITTILNWISQPNNQRVSFSVVGANPNETFSFFSRRSIDFYMSYNVDYTTNHLPTHEVNGIDLSDNQPRLWTFSKINGVFSVHLNNVSKSLTLNPTETWKYMSRGSQPVNSILVGARWDAGEGVVHDWKHIGIITGDKATNLDISQHNSDLMTKYGI